jgi:pseudaminic acid cytidylyltransferase
MNVAIIPARGGSKRIPRKNIREFAGKPMIAHAVLTAKASELFDKVIVSTDDLEIAEVSRTWGAEIPFIRPDELADDHTPTVPVVAHAIENCQVPVSAIHAVCCIYPCVPMLRVEDLQIALRMLAEKKLDYVFPVVAFPSAIQRALRLSPDGTVSPFYDSNVNTRTQDLEPAFYDAGQFYWGTPSAWLSGKPVHSHGYGIETPAWRSVDIDTPDDWCRAELMYKVLSQGMSDGGL